TVASSFEKLAAGEFDLWDSGEVNSSDSIQIEYAGKPLRSRDRCYWQVSVRDDQTTELKTHPAHWSMGLLSSTDWNSQWIAAPSSLIASDPEVKPSSPTDSGPAITFSKTFNVSGPGRPSVNSPASASVSASASSGRGTEERAPGAGGAPAPIANEKR